MNAKSKMRVLLEEGVFEINRVFERECRNPLSDEYKLLQRVRHENPDFVVRVKTIAKNDNKQTYAGLTYACMREYIFLISSPKDELKALEVFDKLLMLSERYSKAIRYPIVKQWFLNEYPEVREIGITNAIAAALQNRMLDELQAA